MRRVANESYKKRSKSTSQRDVERSESATQPTAVHRLSTATTHHGPLQVGAAKIEQRGVSRHQSLQVLQRGVQRMQFGLEWATLVTRAAACKRAGQTLLASRR